MNRVLVRTSSLPRDQLMPRLIEEVEKASNSKGLLQLVMEGNLDFEWYSKIDFVKLTKVGNERNFYFEYDDRISLTPEGDGSPTSGRLEPRKEIIELGNAFIEKCQTENDKKMWMKALEIARTYYDKAAMEE